MRTVLTGFSISIIGLAISVFQVSAMDEGLWMPSQVPSLKERLQKLGVEIDIDQLADPLQYPLNAVVQLGNGCSASFVSAEGLVVTNHHCVEGFLSENSKEGLDLIKLGFMARTRADEIQASPKAQLFVTKSFKDVTAGVLDGVAELHDPTERFKKIQSNREAYEKACQLEAGENMVCEVVSFFQDGQFFEIRKFVIKDVRLVYVPEEEIGFFGGWDDNWRWPRHTGDFGFLRAYVSPDGKSKEFDKDNVPYRPESFLKMASQPLKEGDVIFVTGYPGQTKSLATAFEAKETAEWLFPRTVKMYRELEEVYAEATEGREEARFKAQPSLYGIINYRQNYEGSYPNMIRSRLLADKVQLEAEMRMWMRVIDPDGEKYSNVLDKMERLFAERVKTRARDRAFAELTEGRFSSELLGLAGGIWNYLQEKEKAKGEFDSKKEEELLKTVADFYKNADLILDRAKLEYQLARMSKFSAEDQPDSLKKISRISEASSEKAGSWLYDGSWLTNEEIATNIIKKGSTSQIKADPFIRFAVAIAEEKKEVDARTNKFNGEMATLRPLYVAALREFTGKLIFPDANRTLRVSYGTVQGYSTVEGDKTYTPFSTVDEMFAREGSGKAFKVPARLRAAAQECEFGNYAMANGQMPVNFLSNSHITGGNSGSPTLNGRGEIVGLAFDSNQEGLGSDWRFIPELTRTINVDVRYVYWIMDAVDGADHLLEEMGVQPAISNVYCSGPVIK